MKQNTNNKMGKRGGNSDKKKARSDSRRNDFNKKHKEEETSNVEEDTQPYTSRIATQQSYTSRIATPSPTGRYFSLNHHQSAEEDTQQPYTVGYFSPNHHLEEDTQPNHRMVGTQYQSRMVRTPSYTGRYFPLNHHQYPQERNNNRICYCNDCVQERQVSYGKNTARRCYCYDCVQRDNSFIPNGCYSRSLY